MGAALELVPIGVGAAYGRPGEAQSSHLVRAGSTSVLLDLGAGALNRLCAVQRPETLELIVITHLHPDHLADLLALRVYMAFGPGVGRQARVLGPPGLRERLVAFGGDDGWDEAMHFETIEPHGGTVQVGEARLRLAPVPHLPPTYAVRAEAGGATLCYSADCAAGDELPALAEGCDLLLSECSFGTGAVPDAVPHLNATSAGALAAAAGARALALTHIYPEFDPAETAAAAAQTFGGPVDWVREGETIRLGG